jgi:HD-GYP domain-containing protein (c-di-GMP phosphodiesterase class II)
MSRATKTISIDELRLGMFIERLDRSWLTTPFMRHRFVLSDADDIALLKRYGIKQIVIDPTKGLDVEERVTAPAAPPAPAVSPEAPSLAVSPDAPAASAPRDVPAPAPSTDRPAAIPSRADLAIAGLVHSESVTAMQRILEGITSAVRLDSPALRTMVTRIHDRLIENRSAMMTVTRLQQLQRFDAHIFSHVINVNVLAMAIGIEQGLDAQRLEELALGALLHDIGEMRLPLNLFRKGDALTAAERGLLHQHPRLGIALLSHSREMTETIRRIIVEHHERYDGSGYPSHLRGEAIAPLSQLVGLVDVYDALVTSRYGRPAITPPQAIRQIYKLGLAGQFHKTQVEHMIQCLGVYPIGSLVELSTGERAVVVATKAELSVKPSLKIICDAKGHPYPQPLLIDLSEPDTEGPARAILRDLDPQQEDCRIEVYLDAT